MQIVVYHPHEPTYNPLASASRQLILDVVRGHDVHLFLDAVDCPLAQR